MRTTRTLSAAKELFTIYMRLALGVTAILAAACALLELMGGPQ